MIKLTVENDNPFDAGWIACHMGLPSDCLPDLDRAAKESFDAGYRMREESAPMDQPDAHAHGGRHIALLMMATNQNVRNRVGISLENTHAQPPQLP